ncbi:F0F1 ATP synthase subunit epsilon [Blattabacterium cuenoti]|uniref:F0F1 ATP synthase subunit epsilon n=1 Tax=Blattabacterium cuenoti TaxID=1653831 RepID=UPI00163CA9A0|nr:F0F1 ATP synthase subunit epsilon [Blattabacterium cuenoti]
MKITIINYYKILYQSNIIISIIAPGLNGYFQILKNHAPFISILGNGYLKLLDNNNIEKKIEIKKGIFKIKKNLVIIIL